MTNYHKTLDNPEMMRDILTRKALPLDGDFTIISENRLDYAESLGGLLF